MVDRREPIRVRFIRFGPFSLDIEVFAYLAASDWGTFLDTQQELLLEVMDIVERAGAAIAFPTQTLHLAEAAGATGGPFRTRGTRSPLDSPRRTAESA